MNIKKISFGTDQLEHWLELKFIHAKNQFALYRL